MKHYLALAAALLFFGWAQAQSDDLQDLLQDLKEAQSSRERMILQYEIAEIYLPGNAAKAEEHGKNAFNLATEQRNDGMAARASYLVSQAYNRQRDDRNEEVWLRTTLNYAKKAGDSDLIIRSVDKRSRLATKDRNYRRAYEINQEAFNFFSENGTSISDLEAKFEAQRQQIDSERRNLEKERDQLEFEVRNLRSEANQLNQDKSKLEARQSELLSANRQKEAEISSKTEELSTIAEQKAQAEQLAQKKEAEVNQLSEEAAKQQLVIESTRADLATAELLAEQQKNALYLAIGISCIILLLALLYYSRFRTKRKAAKALEEKNQIIEAERQRSDDLLLNILPAPIALELKQNGRAKARQFDEVTVLFSDFKNFTSITEQLSPDELVQELDKCFKAFDFIIGQYPEVEKIKTIGDAYMCACGLSDRRTHPHQLIKVALEMQQFLDEERKERQRLGKPFFEARIGLHTGPVVAGVVGVRKFAYDIWGDTVNIASRVENNCEPGRVNISETTYHLIKYDFECTYRGKVDAKNKGLLDMYYVIKEKAKVAAMAV